MVFKLFLFLQFCQLSSISQSASVSYKLVSRGGVLIGNIQTPHCEYVPMTNILLQNSMRQQQRCVWLLEHVAHIL